MTTIQPDQKTRDEQHLEQAGYGDEKKNDRDVYLALKSEQDELGGFKTLWKFKKASKI